MTWTLILLTVFYVFTPILILYLCYKFPLADKIGSVILAYIFGLLLGNTGILPSMDSFLSDYLVTNPNAGNQEIEDMYKQALITQNDLMGFQIYKLRDLLTSLTILLAIPLMLFSSNIRQWGKLLGKTFLSLLIGLFSVLSVIIAGYFLFKESGIRDLWKISGLLVGVYTGGTPNLASLKLMLDVDANTYILTHTYDLIIGIFYLAFLLSIGKKFFQKFLPAFPIHSKQFISQNDQKKEAFWSSFKPKTLIPLTKAIAMAIGIVAIGGILAILVPDNLLMVVIILSITTLGILASLIPFISRIEKTFEAGMYLILIFSLVVASMADISNFSGFQPALLGYITLAVFGSLILHLLISRLFKIDSDTTMITSVALVCSPPFVPVIAGSLGNRQIMVSGITIGIIGYALGNYLGFFVANLLKMM
ncbi:DUF819 family protein [Shivajiella indica]|uniref:DUF819 family protein n=1 Tax=Shivajiella indica TaxID=872115 RepID=A0ABW5BAB6_9BACT